LSNLRPDDSLLLQARSLIHVERILQRQTRYGQKLDCENTERVERTRKMFDLWGALKGK
jgi:hypothetical protein